MTARLVYKEDPALWGLLTGLDLYDCDPEIIRDSEKIKQYVVELCDLIGMKRFGPCQVVHFGKDERVEGYSMIQLIEKIANREGIGDLLADGTRIAAQKIGQGAEKFAMQVKGLECAMHQPAGKGTQVLSYSVSPIGATHLEGPHDWTFEEDFSVKDLSELSVFEPVPRVYLGPEKVRQFMYGQISWNLLNTLGLCCFTVGPGKLFKMSHIVESLQAVTGWNTSVWDIMKMGERAVNLRRAVSVRQGFSRKDDISPSRTM